jgi:hypothetical protein
MRILSGDQTLTDALAYCTSCGFIFEAGPIGVANTQNTSLSNTGTNCPVCGERQKTQKRKDLGNGNVSRKAEHQINTKSLKP